MISDNDKISEKIRSAEAAAEFQSFPAMEKVWAGIEQKLDGKALKKENRVWKKIAVAASVLLIGTLTYQWLKPQQERATEEVVISPESVVISKNDEATDKEAVPAVTSPGIRQDAGKMLEQRISSPAVVALQDKISVSEEVASEKEATDSVNYGYNAHTNRAQNRFMRSRSNAAVGVSQVTMAPASAPGESQSGQLDKKADPLLVIDGKAAKGKARDLSTLNPEDVETITVMKEPLYIINGHYYTETQMFGPNPTSPYAPLNKQEIETIKILQTEEAVKFYGERGSKGVVVITTKNRKPAARGADEGN